MIINKDNNGRPIGFIERWSRTSGLSQSMRQHMSRP
jgi:hypothetical protein